jgi:hypothetical protein
MREIRTSGLMSGVGKRGGPSGSVLAPNLDSTESASLTAFATSEADKCLCVQSEDFENPM